MNESATLSVSFAVVRDGDLLDQTNPIAAFSK
jgi:hypothetical protein